MLGSRYSQHSFAQTPAVNGARSSFDRSFNVKDTFDFDYLVPVFVDEIIPGDTANLNVNCFARLATQKVPIMDNMYLEFFFFFVPCRLVWQNWEKFCGAQDNPGDSTDFLIPTISAPGITGFAVDSIYDHFGIPVDVDSFEINALPFRAYKLIWNEWFRAPLIQDSLTISIDDGPDLDTEYELLKRGRRHDYFSACTPEPQNGTAVNILANTAFTVQRATNAGAWRVYQAGSQSFAGGVSGSNDLYPDNGTGAGTLTRGGGGAYGVSLDPNGGLIANLSAAGTINDLREAFQIQSILELDARGGTRFTEILLAHYNVVSPDARLQRPEFLGGGRTTINSHPVPQTSPTAGSNPQAQLASFGTASSAGSSIGFTKSFTEHGYVIGLVNARADVTYQEGLNRMWSRQERFDIFWPKLQEIGDQAVLYKEIKTRSTASPPGVPDNDDVFGYIGRYDDYRYKPSEIRGKFRSQATGTLDFWHLAQELDPTDGARLNDEWMQSSTPIERCIAVPTEPHLLFDCFFQYRHARPMMTYSIPMSLGRF